MSCCKASGLVFLNNQQMASVMFKLTHHTLNDFQNKIIKWTSTILTLGVPQNKESLEKISRAINVATEEIFQYRLNLFQSMDGHLFVGQQPFIKYKKNNSKK